MRKPVLLLLAVSLAVPAPLLAQTTTTDPAFNEVPVETRDDDDDFPWGLLGLLGLAGLLGLRKREPDIHVDARRDQRL